MKSAHLLSIIFIVAIFSCKQKKETSMPDSDVNKSFPTTGSIERIDPRINDLISKGAEIEVIAEGLTWSEGPLWVEDGKYLLFSDIPSNVINKWSEADGVTRFLSPSGYTGRETRGGEPGSNGLLLDQNGKLVMCQHGDRRMARMLPPLSRPNAMFEIIVDQYQGKKFNSPNDAVYDSKGNLYFTDPPYGLEGNMDDPKKELPFQGVFRYSTSGELTLISDEMTRPNGIGLSPDEKILYVGNSDVSRTWMAFELDGNGEVVSERLFYDATNDEYNGYPDGLKVDTLGNIWASGPGGIMVFSPEAELLGRIFTGQATSNCAFDTGQKTLYMTCDDYLMRVKL